MVMECGGRGRGGSRSLTAAGDEDADADADDADDVDEGDGLLELASSASASTVRIPSSVRVQRNRLTSTYRGMSTCTHARPPTARTTARCTHTHTHILSAPASFYRLQNDRNVIVRYCVLNLRGKFVDICCFRAVTFTTKSN